MSMLYKQVEQLRLPRAAAAIPTRRRLFLMLLIAVVLERREVEVRHGLVIRLLLRGGVGRGLAPVAAHVAAERLAHGELEAADGALVRARPVPLGRRRVAEHPRLQARVAGAVPAQRLERAEPLPARLALEHALRRHGPPAAAARRRQREQRVRVHAEALHLLALLRFLPRQSHGSIDQTTRSGLGRWLVPY